MHLAFDIFQGIGIAVALGVRPFLPSLVVGALAADDVEIHFTHTSFHFLQGAPFLILMVVLASAAATIDARSGFERRPTALALALISLALGALFFGGSIARSGHPAVIGLIAGVICAGIALAATRPFLTRLRSRLDRESAAVGVPVIAEGAALLTAVLSVLAPPIGVIALIALLWLLWQGRGGGHRKYAGLRILR